MKKIFVFIIGMVILVGIIGAGFMYRSKSVQQSTEALPNNKKLEVVASFYPLAFLAGEIGGQKAIVSNLTPAGAEPHEYEPTPQDMMNIEKSRLIILNGAGLEVWGDALKKNMDSSHTVLVVASEGLGTEQMMEDGEAVTDPHVWLAPVLVIKMTEKIAEGFASADPANKEYYENNAAKLQKRLHDLDVAYMKGLADCKSRKIVTSHAAFGYLAAAYGLEQVSIAGISPDAEPSAKALTNVASFARENGVKYIFFESLVSPKLAETIAQEIGAETLVLNPLEGLTDEEVVQGKDYFTEMMTNLTHLETALQCNT